MLFLGRKAGKKYKAKRRPMVCHRTALFFRKARKGAVREIFLFQKIPLRGCLGSLTFPEKFPKETFVCYFLRRAISSLKIPKDVLMLLFRLYEKVPKKYTRGPRPSGYPEYGSKFRAVELFDKTQTKRYQEIFMRICNRVQYSSEYFEPVQKGYFTA